MSAMHDKRPGTIEKKGNIKLISLGKIELIKYFSNSRLSRKHQLVLVTINIPTEIPRHWDFSKLLDLCEK